MTDEKEIWSSELTRKRIFAALVAYDINQYDDFQGAVSSHGIGYRTWAYSGDSCDELEAHAVETIRLAKACGAEFIAWRRKPELSQTDGRWKLSMRFHLVPAASNDAFIASAELKPEGAVVRPLAIPTEKVTA